MNQTFRFVIVGSGNMGSALASQLVKASHKVSIVSKDAAHAAALAQKVGAQAAPAASAARDAEVIIVATPYAEATGALRALGDLRGKTVVDITNPLSPTRNLSNPILLTDGTVIAHVSCTSNWYKFTPTITGDYINGTWSAIASTAS